MLEHEVWIGLSRMAFEIAKELQLPVKTGENPASTLRIIMAILFGAEYKTEIVELSGKNAVLIVRRCPPPDRRHIAREHTFHKCMALPLTAVPLLNPKYSARYVRAMCMVKRQCEIKITPNEQLNADSQK